MATVVALVHKSDAAYGVSFPDFPGAIGGGTTETEALQRARDGLALHIESMAEDGDPIPAPRSLEDLRADAEFSDEFATATAIALVDIDLPGKSVRLNISLDETLVARIDRRAKEIGETRSGFLAVAARSRLSN
jgi:predicted RNase H-like HicB family nuclease